MFKQMLKILLMLAVVCGAHAIPFGSSPFDSAQGTIASWLSGGWLSGAEAHAAIITLPKTGQTICYNNFGDVIACAGTGQDGDKLKGAAWPTPRFTDNANGTLLDNLTGLVWLKNADCFGTQTWQQALDSANALLGNNTQCSLNDGSVAGQWRLPNRSEMDSLINYQQADGGAWLNGQGFVNAKNSYYWTSSSFTPVASDKWIVHTLGVEHAESVVGAGVYSLIPVRDFNAIIGTSPASKDFGSVTTSTTSASQTFTISNSGIDPLTVSSITLTGGDSAMFALTVGDGTAGTCGATPTIAAAGSCTISASFTPTSTGVKSSTLRIASNDPATPNKDIALSGTGATTGGTRTYTWSTTGGTSNTVYRIAPDGITISLGSFPAATLSYTDTTALSNTIYTYCVKKDDAGSCLQSTTIRTPLYNGWNIIGVPYDTTGIAVASLFSSATSTAYEWISKGSTNPDNNGSYITLGTLTPGKGYFIKAGNSSTMVAYTGAANAATVDVTLKPGWTLISNPYTTNKTGIGTSWLISGLGTLDAAVTASKIGGDVYWWNGNTYDSWKITDLTIPANSAVIEPWKAYWILNMDTIDHTLTMQ